MLPEMINRYLILMISTSLFATSAESGFSGQTFVRKGQNTLCLGEVIKMVNVSTTTHCAIVCQTASECSGFNINRRDMVPQGRLLCQVLADKGGGHTTTTNDHFDYYEVQSLEKFSVSTVDASPVTTTAIDKGHRKSTKMVTTIHPASTSTQPSLPCGNNRTGWSDSIAQCKSIGMPTMSAISSSLRSSGLTNMYNLQSDLDARCTYWTGIYTEPTKNGVVWKTTDGSTLYNFNIWDEGQPPDDAQLMTQPHYVHAKCLTGKWTATPDDKACRYYFCSLTKAYFELYHTQKTAIEIKNDCQARNAKMKSACKKRFDVAYQYAMALVSETDPKCTYWIGLYSQPMFNSVVWTCTDGAAYDDTKANWEQGQPPGESQLKSQLFYAYANCSTGKWSVSDNLSDKRGGMCG